MKLMKSGLLITSIILCQHLVAMQQASMEPENYPHRATDSLDVRALKALQSKKEKDERSILAAALFGEYTYYMAAKNVAYTHKNAPRSKDAARRKDLYDSSVSAHERNLEKDRETIRHIIKHKKIKFEGTTRDLELAFFTYNSLFREPYEDKEELLKDLQSVTHDFLNNSNGPTVLLRLALYLQDEQKIVKWCIDHGASVNGMMKPLPAGILSPFYQNAYNERIATHPLEVVIKLVDENTDYPQSPVLKYAEEMFTLLKNRGATMNSAQYAAILRESTPESRLAEAYLILTRDKNLKLEPELADLACSAAKRWRQDCYNPKRTAQMNQNLSNHYQQMANIVEDIAWQYTSGTYYPLKKAMAAVNKFFHREEAPQAAPSNTQRINPNQPIKGMDNRPLIENEQ